MERHAHPEGSGPDAATDGGRKGDCLAVDAHRYDGRVGVDDDFPGLDHVETWRVLAA
jgi:hypothetical protein